MGHSIGKVYWRPKQMEVKVSDPVRKSVDTKQSSRFYDLARG